MSKAAKLLKRHFELVNEMHQAIRTNCERLIDQDKSFIDHNNAFGKVIIVELRERIRLKDWNDIRGVAVQGDILYLYIQDTSNNGSARSGADFLMPFDAEPSLTSRKLIELLAALEKE